MISLCALRAKKEGSNEMVRHLTAALISFLRPPWMISPPGNPDC
jgi:hypothetical protein